MQSLHRVEKSHASMVKKALRKEISRLSVSLERFAPTPIPAHSPTRDDGGSGQHWTRLRREGSEGSEGSKGGGGALRAQSSYMAPNLAGGQPTTDSEQPTTDSGHPPANACYPAKGTPKGISIQNTHASMTWFSKLAAGVIVEGAGRKDVSFPIISFEEAYYGELQSL